jgi:hypothetical protein
MHTESHHLVIRCRSVCIRITYTLTSISYIQTGIAKVEKSDGQLLRLPSYISTGLPGVRHDSA